MDHLKFWEAFVVDALGNVLVVENDVELVDVFVVVMGSIGFVDVFVEIGD